MIKEDIFMNNLQMNINNIFYQTKINGIYNYNKLLIILTQINKYQIHIIKINKLNNQDIGYNVKILIIINRTN